MAVTHVTPAFVTNLDEGITRNVHGLTRALKTQGLPVSVDAPQVSLENMNHRRHHLLSGLRAHGRLRHHLGNDDTKLVHYHVGLPAMGVFARMARARLRSRAPLIVHAWNAHFDARHVHGKLPWSAVFHHRLLNGVVPATLGLLGADMLIVSSQYQADQIRAAGMRMPVRVIPNGVDIQEIQPADETRKQISRAAFDLTGDPVVVYYGHLSPWKGVDHYLKALVKFLDDNPKAQAVVAHTQYGAERDPLPARLKSLGLDDRVRVMGHVHVPTLLAAADIVVVPTIAPVGTACHPNVLLESLAAGVAVVTTRVGSIPEVVTDGVNGLLTPPADPDAISAALTRLATDTALRRRLGANARKLAVERFDWDRVAAKVVTVYRELGYTGGVAPSAPLPAAQPPLEVVHA